MLQKALEACDDDILRLAINLAFSCSLRMGELLGLTWDCIDISPTSIELGQASIFVEKELQRVNREAMADLDGKDIMFKFPPTFASTHTALVLKTPKTKTSVRKVFLPKTVAEMLVQRKADIEELKDLFGDEFVDFNLVFCSSNGKPIEGQVINRAFNIEAFSKERNDEYVGRAEEYKAAKSALLEGLGLEHLFDHSHELTPKEKEIWMLFDRVDVAELLARDAFAKGAYMLGAEDREIMLK